jgi:secondary thiamine-phosphate synthase enzyme
MKQRVECFEVATQGQGLLDITERLRSFIRESGVHTGLLTVFCTHTSASLLIQENASPDVRADLLEFFERIAPEESGRYRHDDEGLDDMPAHLRAALTQVQLAIPVMSGGLVLGTWQGVYLFEHRRRPHQRRIALHLLGE